MYKYIYNMYTYVYIYIVAPPQVFSFEEIRKLPQEDHQICDAKPYVSFDTANAILH